MTIAAESRTKSIKLSVNKFLSDATVAGGALVGITFNFQNSWFSPDTPTELDQWVDVSPIQEMAGAKGAYLLQLDIYGRTKDDRFRDEIDIIKDKICNRLNVNRIKIWDFTNAGVPCNTGRWLIPINSNGQVGIREDCTYFDMVEGIVRCGLRFRFMRLTDLSKGRYCPSKG